MIFNSTEREGVLVMLLLITGLIVIPRFVRSGKPAFFFLTSSLRTPKFFVKEFSYFLMPCHQHGLRINLLVQR